MKYNYIKASLMIVFACMLHHQAIAESPVSLNGQWTLHFWSQPETPITTPEAMRTVNFQTIPAKVPGNVELDLLAADLIHDPMTGDNIWELRPYEGYQW